MISQQFIFNLDVWIEAFSCLVALLIAAFSFRAYIITRQRKHFFFTAAFGMIAVGIAFSALLNYYVQFENLHLLFRGFVPVTMNQGYVLAASMLCVLFGYVTLFIVNSEMRDKRAMIMLYMMAFFSVLVAHELFFVYHLTTFIVVGSVFSHYLVNYEKQSTKSSLFVLLAFTALLVSEAILIFTVYDYSVYVAGNFVRLIGYLLFLITLVYIYIFKKK